MGDPGAPGLFERNAAAFREHEPRVWARLEALAAPVTTRVDGDGVVDNIDLGRIRLYPEPAPAWTERQLDEYFQHPDRLGFEDLGHCNLSAVSKKLLWELRNELLRAEGSTRLAAYPVVDTGYAFVFGIGLGYHVQRMVEQGLSRYLILIEPIPEFVLHSMHAIDWAAVFETARERDIVILFVFAADPDAIIRKVEEMIRLGGITLLDGSYAYVHYYSWALQQARALLNERIKIYFVSGGFFEDEILMMKNAYANFTRWPFFLVDRRRFLEQRMPTFIVGSGPSLDQDMPYLKAWRERAIVVSCGTALGILLRNGIRPDFHVENENSGPLLDNLLRWKDEFGLDGITLMASTTVIPEVCGLFDRRWLYFRAPLSPAAVLNRSTEALYCADPLVSNAGSTVAATVGLRTQYLFGVDCGRPKEGEHHARDAVYYDEDFVENPDDSPAAGFEREVPGNFGGTMLTTYSLDLSRRTFTSFIENRDVTIYNCSAGARIDGARPKAAAAIRLDEPPGRQRLVLDRIEAQLKHFEAGAFLDGLDLEADIAGCRIFVDALSEALEGARAEDDGFWELQRRLRVLWTERGVEFEALKTIIGGTFASMIRLGAFAGTRMENADARRAFFHSFLDHYFETCAWMAEETAVLLSEIAERRPEISDVGRMTLPAEDLASVREAG